MFGMKSGLYGLERNDLDGREEKKANCTIDVTLDHDHYFLNVPMA